MKSVYIYLVKSILGGLTNFILFAFTIKSSIMLADCAVNVYSHDWREVAKFKGSRFSFKATGSAPFKK